MINSVEYYGVWWLPASPENKFKGKVKFIPGESINLELYGQFYDYNSGGFDRFPDIILGEAYNKKKITLYENAMSSIDGASSSRSYYWSNMLFVGKHFNKAEDIRFVVIDNGRWIF